MKKGVYFFIAFLFFTSQKSMAQKINFGIKMGLAFSNCTIKFANPSNSFTSTSRTGFLLGGVLNVAVSKNISFRPECDLVFKGTARSYNYQGAYNENLSLTYVDFPLNILYEIENPKGKFSVGAGPVISFRINNNSYTGLETSNPDIGGNIVTAYEFPIGFFINLNYTYGFRNISTNKNYITELKNHYFGISLGYMF